MLAELWRAARPPVRPSTRTPSGGDLGTVAAWQSGLFGTWPEGTIPTWVPEVDAVGLPVVSAFLEILTSLVVQMPLHAYRDGAQLEADPPILRNPAPGPGRTLGDWVGEYLRSMALRGNFVAVLGDDSWTGWPDVMYPVPPGQWSVSWSDDDGVVYMIGGRRYLARDVFHVRRNVEPGELVGRGLLDTHIQLLAASVAAEQWAARYFTGGAVPPAVLTSPDPDLTQDQADQVKGKYNLVAQARQALVLPAGWALNALASDAEKAQLADTRRANDAKLAVACGIPGALLGLEGPSLTYRNITDVFQQFVTTTVMGYLEPLEQALTDLTLPRGTEARFSTAAVLRPDIPARVTIATEAYGAGIMTLAEARSLLDLSVPAGPDVSAPRIDAGVEQGRPPELEVVAS